MTIHNASSPILLSSLPTALKKFLCSFAGYFDGTVKRFELTSSGELILNKVATDQAKIKCIVLIVARPYYLEQSRTYPIENNKELNKLLKLELSSSAKETTSFFHAWSATKVNGDKTNNQSLVNIWQYSEVIPPAYLTLPESLLLALSMPANQVLFVDGDKQTYFAHVNNLIHSLSKTAVVNSPQRFAMSVGITESQPVQVVNQQGLPDMLAVGLKKLSLPIILSFIKLPKIESRFQLIKNTALPVLAILIVYLAGTSGYITFKKYNLQQQLSAQRGDVSAALNQQVDFDNQSIHYKSLQQFIASQNNSSHFWLIMAELFPHAQFTNIRADKGRFVLRGSALKATVLLEMLSKNKQINDAKFDFSVRKNRGKEVFVISFELVNLRQIQDNKNIEEKMISSTLTNGGAHG